MKKKLGFFLAIIFGLFFFLGTNVHAEGEKEGWYIGDTQYATFNEAYTAAKTGALTIDRYGDYTQTEDIALAKCVRINMVRGTYTQQGTITCNYNPVYLASSSGEGIYELGTISIASGKNITFESGEFRNLVANSTLLGKMTFQKNDNSLHAVFKIYDESTNELFANKVDSYSVKTDLNPGTQYRICSRGESYASKQSTKASLKTTYTTRGYWKRVSDPASEVKNGTQLLIGYYWSATESLILMKNYENASYQRMYTGANYRLTRWAQPVEKELNDVTPLTYNSFQIGDSLKNYLFTYHVDKTTYLSNGDSDYVLYSADGNHLRLGAKSTVVNNKYDYSISIRSNGVYLSGGYVTFGQKITNTGTQGMCYLSNSGAYTNNGQMTYDLMCHAYVYVEECVVSNTSLRFGGFVSYFDATSMISGFGESVTYGIIAAGITHIVGDLTVENATYNQEITPVRVANIGDSEETTEEITEANLLTDYYQFALVIDNIPKEYYEYELMARAYICVDGTYYYFQPTRYSVKTIAQAYLDAADTSAYTEHLDVLVYLAA